MRALKNVYRPLCLTVVALVCVAGRLQAQEAPSKTPIEVTITDLSLHPQEFDGRLVYVRAVLALSWEGDNFLSEPTPQGVPPHGQAYVWIYWKPERERQVYWPIKSASKGGSVFGWFTGYFHFVPDHVANARYDPGPFQFEAVGAIPERQTQSLSTAIRQSDLEGVRKIIHSGAKLNIWDEYHSFPLSEASKLGNADLVEELLQAGANPNLVGPSRDTALQAAAWNCKVGVAKVQLAHGAAVNAADGNGEAPLALSAQTCPDGEMTQVLLDAKADPNPKAKGGYTALMAAARNPIVAEKLLKAGADPAAKSDSGNTAESESCDRGAEGFYRVCQLVRKALGKSACEPGSCN
jgi:Ankyrin repeats (3 copies)